MSNDSIVFQMSSSLKLVLMTLFISLALFSISAFASDPSIAPSVVESASKVGWMSGLLALALQIAKSDLLGGVFAKIDKAYQPAVVLVIGQLAGLIESVATGKPLGQAAVEWLLSSGNAMALYTVIFKPFSKKKEVKV